MQIENITTGESWACKFRVSAFVDNDGNIVDADLSVGQKHPGKPGVYESLGVIQIRDTENKLVQLLDTKTKKEFCVSWNDCWDIDTIEWVDNE